MLQALLANPRQALNSADVAATLELDSGVTVRHGVDVLSTSDVLLPNESLPVDFTAGGEVVWSYRPPDPIVDGRNAETTQAANVRRTATLALAGAVGMSIVARRYRIWTELLSPLGVWVRFHLGVFVPTLPTSADDGMAVRHTLTLADKTYRYMTRQLVDPLVIATSTNCVDWVKTDLGSRFGETAFNITSSSVTLAVSKVFEPGTSLLDVYNAMLETAGYDQLTADENGRPTSVPLADLAARGPEITYGPGASKIVTAGSIEPLVPDVPNVVRFVARQGPSLATEGNGIRTKTNTNVGPASVTQRGESVEKVVEVEAENQTQLDAIADADSQRYFAGGGLRFTGSIGLNPRHGDRDVIALDKPRLGLAGTWLVTSWRYPLRAVTGADAVLMPITCERRV